MKERIVVILGMSPEVTAIVQLLKFQLETCSSSLQIWKVHDPFVTFTSFWGQFLFRCPLRMDAVMDPVEVNVGCELQSKHGVKGRNVLLIIECLHRS
jgi:hypothetical protein